MNQSIILLFASLLITHGLCAQSVNRTMDFYFDSLRAGLQASLPNVNDTAVDGIRPYLRDADEVVRISARQLLFAAASASRSVTMQSQAVEQLLASTETNDVRATGIVISMIKTFRKSVFTDSAKTHVRRLLKAEGPYLREWMKIAGFLELKDLDNYIRPYSQPGNPQSTRWSALLSLARMGDKRCTAEVLSRVKKIQVNDDVVYQLFPDLVFTRDRDAIHYMVEVLQADDNRCLSADIERETWIPCGYRIMEQLAPIVEGFPLPLNDSGDVNAADYRAALATVRQWFKTHKNYSLRKEQY